MSTKRQSLKKILNKIYPLITIVVALSFFQGSGFANEAGFMQEKTESNNKILRIVGWDVYADPVNKNKTIGYKDFEKNTGFSIHFTPLSNLEEIIGAAESLKNYDVFIVSNEGIHILNKMNLVSSLDLTKISNFKNLSPSLLSSSWIQSDTNVFAAPWAWGPTGLLYNTDTVAEPESWGILWDPKHRGKVSLWNDVSMIWVTALSLGYNNVYNLTKQQLSEVKEKLLLLNNQAYDYYAGGDQAIDYIRNGEITILNSWFDPSARLKKENLNLKMIIPKEGAVGMFDSFLISSRSKNIDIAHQYINNQLTPSVQKNMVRTTGLSPANSKTVELLTDQEIKSLHLDEKDYFDKMLLWNVMPRKHLYEQLMNEINVDLKNKLTTSKKLKLSVTEQRWLKTHSNISFAGDPNWLPYEAFQPNGEYIGIVADHLKLIEKLTSLNFKPVPTSDWTESLQIASEGKVSVISGDAADVVLNKRFNPVDAYSHNPIVIIMNTDQNYVENLAKIKDKKIAIIKDYGYTADIFKQYPNFNFIEVNNIQSGLEGVADGSFDAMLATLALSSYHIAELGIHNIKIVGKTPIVMDLTLFIDKELPELHSIINKALKSVTKSQSNVIFQSWNKHDYVEKTDYVLIFQIVFAALLLISVFVFWNRRLSHEISLRIQTENEIEKNRAQFKAMFESIPDAIVYADAERKIQLVNKATRDIFGYDKNELTGQYTKKLYADDSDFKQQGKKRYNEEIVSSNAPYIIKYRKKSGNEFDGETLGTAVKSPDGNLLGYLGIIRDISERTHVDAILRSLAAGGSSLNIDSFLNDILERLTELYDCKYAFVGQLQPDCKRIQTLAVRANGKPADNFNYSLNGTPCKDILDHTKELIPKDASILYPDDTMLIDMGIESYFGAPLLSADNKIIGILSVMDTSPLNLDEWTEPVLGVFATRVSLELERNQAIQELQQHREDLESLVKERTADLITARDEAERANESKSDFLSRMSHELRTPMNAILGFSQILETNVHGNLSEADLSYINEVLKGGYHLLDLINEVLDLSRVESGQLQFKFNDFELIELINEAISLIKPLADKSDLKIHLLGDNERIFIHADKMRIKQIILNLLSNAVKYNCKNGTVELNCKINGPKVRLSIHNTGPYIPETMHDRVFDPFDRLNADTALIEGTGIGLSLSKKLIELMHGTIGFSSSENKGTTFWIEMNLSDAESLSSNSIEQVKLEYKVSTGEFTVLYVEDNPANLRLVSHLLESQGNIKLLDTHTASLAIDLINTHRFDLILLDIQLPGEGDGFDVLKKIRTTPAIRDVPVVGISANATEYDIEHGLNAGFDDYITKPLKIDRFMKIINRYLS